MKTFLSLPLIVPCWAAILSGLVAAEPAPAAKPSARYTLDNCINTFDPAKTEKTAVGYQYWFIGQDFADGKTVKLSVVGPHLAVHGPHNHVEDEIFFVLEGKAEFCLDGQWRAVPPNTSLYCPSGREHGIRNAGDSELKYLVIAKYDGPVPPPR